jgi:hypothetical protein
LSTTREYLVFAGGGSHLLLSSFLAHFVELIEVIHIATLIEFFADEEKRFAITGLTAVKDADLYHFSHLLSRQQKKPASKETG